MDDSLLPATDSDNSVLRQNFRKYVFALITILITLLIVWWLTSPPRDFPVSEPLTIESGLSAVEVINELKSQSWIKSSSLLYLLLLVNFDAKQVKAGTYKSDKPLTLFEVVRTITSVAPPEALIKLTLPEGFTVAEFALIASETLIEFDQSEFVALANRKEGKLFPDTYQVPIDYSEAELLELLTETYLKKLSPLREEISKNKLSEEGIIILASLLEREANTEESRRLVAGILDTRLALGMPLQVDASMEYILHKPLKDLTPEDLAIDSPYNTYLYKGLPPTPIGNPGLAAILAVLFPEPSDYLFYLTDADGQFHYAQTFAEHKINVARYLK